VVVTDLKRWEDSMFDGRATANINEGKSLKEMTIVERLRRAVLENDSHKLSRATDMP
jgi:hypothetical protein